MQKRDSHPLSSPNPKGEYKVTFWGTRGVHPCDDPAYKIYGGNTICTSVKLRFPSSVEKHIIFDAGSGIIPLGKKLFSSSLRHLYLFFSHVHLDHILGLPYFLPLWDAAWTVEIFCGYLRPQGGARACFTKYIAPPVFPVPLESFPAKIIFHDIGPGERIRGDGFDIQTFPLNHPNNALGFRLHSQGKVFCHVTDTEHIPGEFDAHVLKGIEGADLVIYDSTYTDETWECHKGWGHSTWQEGVRLCQEASVKKLGLYHHDPLNTDPILKSIEEKAQNVWAGTFATRQNMSVSLLS